jgi:hypothetical protein
VSRSESEEKEAVDEATADEATADEATADEATADEATADEAMADDPDDGANPFEGVADTARGGSYDGSEAPSSPSEADPDVLRAQIALLEAENDRLRREYARARRTSYRRTARGLGAVGVVAVVGAIVFPAVREVLLVLGTIGLFGGILTYYLTPERFVAAATGERIYAALDDTLRALADQLDLADEHVYVPVDGDPSTRLFVPAHEQHAIPDEDALRGPLVVTEDDRERGLSVVPTGAYLFGEFERTLTGSFGDDPTTAVEQLTDGLVEGFELVDAAEFEVDAAGGRVTVEVEGSVYGAGERFDTPVASFLAVGVARAVETSVRTVVHTDSTTGDDPGSFTVTCQFEDE